MFELDSSNSSKTFSIQFKLLNDDICGTKGFLLTLNTIFFLLFVHLKIDELSGRRLFKNRKELFVLGLSDNHSSKSENEHEKRMIHWNGCLRKVLWPIAVSAKSQFHLEQKNIFFSLMLLCLSQQLKWNQVYDKRFWKLNFRLIWFRKFLSFFLWNFLWWCFILSWDTFSVGVLETLENSKFK